MDLDYNVIYSRRKTLSITVERNRSVLVRAPEGTDPEKIRKIIEAKKLWIYEKTHHPQKYNGLPHPPGKELVSGESLPYLGRNYRIEVVDGDADGIRFEQKFIVPRKLSARRREVFRKWYMDRAREKILPRVRRQALSLGVEFNEAKIADSRYRWGSCTTKDNLNFNWRLIKAQMFVIDYVIAHELAHLMEPNHTPRFWNIVRSQVLNAKRAKVWLKEHGEFLEQDL
jgi:predicted metal-dependent hydrolase